MAARVPRPPQALSPARPLIRTRSAMEREALLMWCHPRWKRIGTVLPKRGACQSRDREPAGGSGVQVVPIVAARHVQTVNSRARSLHTVLLGASGRRI